MLSEKEEKVLIDRVMNATTLPSIPTCVMHWVSPYGPEHMLGCPLCYLIKVFGELDGWMQSASFSYSPVQGEEDQSVPLP